MAQQIAELEQSISELIEADPLWRQFDRAFRTIKGVGDRTVANMMAEMPEIGTLSNKTISKLAGLAPLANDSGKQQGKRRVRGGRGAVRDLLFIVGSVVGRHELDFMAMESVSARPTSRPKWSASQWHTNFWFDSTQKPERYVNCMHKNRLLSVRAETTAAAALWESGKRPRRFPSGPVHVFSTTKLYSHSTFQSLSVTPHRSIA